MDTERSKSNFSSKVYLAEETATTLVWPAECAKDARVSACISIECLPQNL